MAGAIAAIAAARAGVDTLLVEEQAFLGGTLTSMGVGPMMSFHNDDGEQMVKGIPDELIERLKLKNGSPGHIPDTTTYCSTVTPFDSELLKIELETMLTEAGGQVLFHTQLAEVNASASHIESVTVCNKGGLSTIRAKVFIDATGDGDLAMRAAVPFAHGREQDNATQPMTMNLKLANINTEAIRQYAISHPDNFLWANGKEEGLRRLQLGTGISLAGFLSEWKQAVKDGIITIPRDQVLLFETANPGVVIVNTSRILGLNPTNPHDLSKAEIIGRQQCYELFNFLRDRCIGFGSAVRMDTAAKVGVRESRHIRGLYTLSAEDLLTCKKFDDCIACGGYPIDVHSPDGNKTITQRVPSYQIPLRSLLTAKPENLVVVGRCVSATHEAAAAIRVTPIVMAIGQAGGTVAAEALHYDNRPASVPAKIVQSLLLDQGAYLAN